MKQILDIAYISITLGCLALMAVRVWHLIGGRAYRIGAHGSASASARHVDAHLAYGPWRG
jgi:hypothetical protein